MKGLSHFVCCYCWRETLQIGLLPARIVIGMCRGCRQSSNENVEVA